MKICPVCKYQNFFDENNCEICKNPIQNLNHQRFRLQDQLPTTIGIFLTYISLLKAAEYLENVAPSNTPTLFFQAIRVTITSAILLFLFVTTYSSYLYDNPRRQINNFSGDFLVYFGLNAIFILGILVFVAIPDKNGIILLPSLLYYVSTFISVKTLKDNNLINRQKIVTWAFVLYVWSFIVFLIGLYSVLIFDKYNLSPELWGNIELIALSLSFLFFGVFTGGIIVFCTTPSLKPSEIINYMFYSNPKDVLLEIALYGAIYVAFISPAIGRVINYIAS